MGPIGATRLILEAVSIDRPSGKEVLMSFENGKGFITTSREGKIEEHHSDTPYQRQLAISMANHPNYGKLYNLLSYLKIWWFYNSFNINRTTIRRGIPIEQEPVLREDAGNISSVLHYFFMEYRSAFDEVERHLKAVVPGFRGLQVKARGGPGEVITFWKEEGVESDLTLADLSEGILNLIIWITICVQPYPPPLICIDEPELGLHPRTLPLLAGLMKKLSERTQIFIATHDSYFLTQFPLNNITVMRKENGEVIARKPKDSEALKANLEDFGTDELEAMHRNDELEALS